MLPVLLFMVVAVIIASTVVNVLFTIVIHYVDCSFGFQDQEKELLEHFIMRSFSLVQ
jgi:hypothetical protein